MSSDGSETEETSEISSSYSESSSSGDVVESEVAYQLALQEQPLGCIKKRKKVPGQVFLSIHFLTSKESDTGS